MVFAGNRICALVALTLLLALFALAGAASSASAAEPKAWGELPAFTPAQLTGEAGKLNKEFFAPKFAAAPGGAYYVLLESTFVGKFVLQRFDEDKLEAETEIEPPASPKFKKCEEENCNAAEAVNGALAVDPNPKGESSRERVYVLFVYRRREQTKEEENHEPVQYPLDMEMQAAGSLYAFTYESAGKKLVSAKSEVKSKKEVPLPALSREQLHGEAEEEHASSTHLEPGERSLLDPRGLTVDPSNGDLAITGNEDVAPMESVQKEGQEKQCRAAVQFVTVGSGLTLSPGARYVDEAGKVLFGQTACGGPESEETGEESGIDQAPASPVFAPDGTVLGYGEDPEVAAEEPEGIVWQLTPKGADEHQTTKAGEVVSMTPTELFVAGSVPTFDPAVGLAEEPDSIMSLVPAGESEGTMYISGFHWPGRPPGGQPTLLVLHYNHPTGGVASISEVGWTAGGAEEGVAPGPCDLHSTETTKRIAIGGLAGSNHGLLAFTYYTENVEPKPVARAEVVRFGEGASTKGCPTVAPTTPTQTYQGKSTSELPAGQPLEVISVLGTPGSPELLAASPTSVTWTVKFTPVGGKTEELHFPETHFEYNGLHAVEPGYGDSVKLALGAAKVGAYEIVDTVHTDDLADEVATSNIDTVTVTHGKLEVKPETPEPATVVAHEKPVSLKVEPKVEGVESLDVTNVVWEFPTEGTKVDETAPRQLAKGEKLGVTHTFGRCGSAKSTKCNVNVTVVADGETAKTQLQVTVQESKAEEEAETPPPTTTPTTPTTTTPTPTPTPTTPTIIPPAGGVEAYIASFTGSSLSVSASGATSVKVACPTGGSCSGTLALQTLSAVAAAGSKKKKVLTLATGSFSLAGGSKPITLHLSSQARALLSHSHGALRVKLTILSRGTGGRKNEVTTHVVTLRLLTKKKH